MDHPLIANEQLRLRQRVVSLYSQGFRAQRASNIVFVCGGNDTNHMRPMFGGAAPSELSGFELFWPEYAMKNFFANEAVEPFDIADFEELVGNLSHAIVIFPEAAGSFAEIGYFSAIPKIASKCILVLNKKYQGSDSFISLGPAKKIAQDSQFHPVIQLDYGTPDFSPVCDRIKRSYPYKNKKKFEIRKFSEMSPYDIICFAHSIVDIMSIATLQDIDFMFKLFFKNRYSRSKVHRLVSVLVGAGYLAETGDYGHLARDRKKPSLLEVRDGYQNEESSIRIALAELYQEGDPEFLSILKGAYS